MNNQTNLSLKDLNDKNDEKELDDDYIKLKLSKKNVKKLEIFEKFNPKNISNQKRQPSLKGAENKVRNILSSFLMTMESEDENSGRIKFLMQKISTKKIKVGAPKKSKKNLTLKKEKNLNSLFIKGTFNNNETTQENMNSALISDEKRENKESQHKKIKRSSKKVKISNLKLHKYNNDSNTKSDITGPNIITSNFKSRISDLNRKSNLSSREGKNNMENIKKQSQRNSNSIIKSRESTINKNSEKYLKFSLVVDENDCSKISSNDKYKSSIIRSDYNEQKHKDHLWVKNKKFQKQRTMNVVKPLKNKYKLFPDKRKFLFSKNNKNIKNNTTNKNTNYLKVENVLKDLQEKIKNSIILRPEELQNNEEKTNRRKFFKEVNNLENESKQLKLIYNKNSTKKSIFSQKDLKIKNDYVNELTNKKTLEKKNINNKKLNLVKNKDIFKSSNFKNDTEIEALKSGFNEQISSNILPNVSLSSKYNINIPNEKFRIFNRKKLIYDSLDDEEIEDEINDDFYISPESNFTIIFDMIILFISLYSLIFFPYYIAHSLSFCRENFFSFRRVLNLFIELFYILDLILGFFRAYYNFEEQLIKRHSSIIKKYIYTWFIFDLIGSIPVFTIIKFNEKKCDLHTNSNYYNYILNNINYLFLCNRLLKVIKSISYNQAYNLISKIINEYQYFNIISFLFTIIFILLFFHLTSCIYIFIGRNSYPNWIYSINLNEKKFFDIYIASIYLLITALTTVGYGDITCYSFKERIFQLILLIVGIVAYSWIISYISNYVKKFNEQSLDFENKKGILDEIKLTNPNLTNDLYDRILRYLKYKKFHENKNKNIIFDCLPIALKNNLITEMYKPIITNFIFLKNFENLDFIVRVVLSFRPIFAIKNDILVNENDFIEEIIFVKNGVLTVELPLNMKDPEENINKYLNNPIFKNKDIYDNSKNNTLFKVETKSVLNSTFKNTLNREVVSKFNTKKIIKNKDISYVKILNIRENEHFGDVLMFLEQRSPLRLRVRSKKSELFFLKKIDAVNISSNYPNIWRRINKKSVFNFKQIKNSILKIVELYCSYKKIQNDKKIINIKNNKVRRKSMIISNSLALEKDINIKRSFSQKKIQTSKYKEFFNDDDSENSFKIKSKTTKTFSNINIKTKRTENTENLLNIFDIDSSSISKINNQNSIKKNKSLFNNINNSNTNKYNIVINREASNANSIIKEEPLYGESLIRNNSINKGTNTNYAKVNINHKITTCSFFNKKANQTEENEKKENEEEDEEKTEKEGELNYIDDEYDKNDSLGGLEDFRNKYILNQEEEKENNEKSSKIKDKSNINYYSNKEEKVKQKKLSDDYYNEGIDNESSIYKIYEINKEIYKDENLEIPKSKITYKKLNSINLNNKINIITKKNNDFNEKSKLELLLESNTKLNRNTDNNSYLEKSFKNNNLNDINNDNRQKCILLENNKNIIDRHLYLSIESNIKFQILAIYENINLLSKYKYHQNKVLQLKVKNILEKQDESHISFSSSSSDNSTDKKINQYNSMKNNILLNPKIKSSKVNNSQKMITKKKTTNSHNSAFIKSLCSPRKPKFESRKRNSVFIKNDFNFLNDQKYNQKMRSELSLGFYNKNNSKMKSNLNLNRKSTQVNDSSISVKNNFLKDNEKNKNNKTIIINNDKKRKDSLLTKINFNIRKTNFNLNNPDEFYSYYFKSILQGEKKNLRKNDKRFSALSIIHSPKMKYKRKETKAYKENQIDI